ncbi:MAG: toll/interleukin-1 receptor domain-containing protein [Verrucomicrobiae bacterium]|nr:toll/interleukin-1 receptor domain-containing protein [Verrucomicrobiae bacterium]MCB1090051.1 toll/interleukin-1 receptor domain-containing protein [Verrucomicrobiae bacterium]
MSSELLFEMLCSRLGKTRVLKDVHSAPLGEDFRSWISENVRQSRVMLAIIGPKWLPILRERQLTGGDDYVLAELEEASAMGIPIIAVLVDGATMPTPDDFPSQLRGLSFLNALSIPPPPHFSHAVLELAARLAEQFPELLRRPETQLALPFLRAKIALAAAFMTVLAVTGANLFFPAPQVDRVRLSSLLHNTLWIEYSPPMEEAFSSLPEEDREIFADKLRNELGVLKAAGFTGILSNGDTGATVMIPYVAKELGLKVIVICGFLGNSKERETALARCFLLRDTVDGYCIGYDSLTREYQAGNLQVAINRLKKRTGLPTATTQPAAHYPNNERLISLGDWLFPEVHLDLSSGSETDPTAPADRDAIFFDRDSNSFSTDVDRDVERFRLGALQLAEIARAIDKPLVFNGVSYPHDNVKNASPTTQAAFFGRLIDALANPRTGLGLHLSMVPHSAFDREWRIYINDPDSGGMRPRPGYEIWMSYTGLFSYDGQPRPAVWEILKRHPNWLAPSGFKEKVL